MKIILFLLRELLVIEKNYWLIELEIAGFVQTIRKIRYMVESYKHPIIVQTNHSAIVDIIRKSSITSTNSTIRMNTRLVRTSQFLRQFRLEVRYKLGKEYIVPNALLRLTAARPSKVIDNYLELDALYSGYEYSSTQVQISNVFRARLNKAYTRDARQVKVIKVLDNKASIERKFDNSVVASLPFIRGSNNKIFHVNKFTSLERLYIPEPLVKDIFDIAYNDSYLGFKRYYKVISKSQYIHGLTRLLRKYIRHYPQCLVFQTHRYYPYGALQLIQSLSILFYTLTLNFIVALPTTVEGYDSTLTVTDKFTKRITYILGKSTQKVKDQVIILLDRLNIVDQGLPKILLINRNPKFLVELQEAIFYRLGIELLYSTTYYPQTNNSSKRTN